MTRPVRFALGATFAMALAIACAFSDAHASQQDPDPLANLRDAMAKGGWNGFVTIAQSANFSTSYDDHVCCSGTSTVSLVQSSTIDVTHSVPSAKVSYELDESGTTLLKYDDHTVSGSKTEVTTASGTNDFDSRVSVTLYGDGTYTIEYKGGGVKGKYKMQEATTTTCNSRVHGDCHPTATQNEDQATPDNLGGLEGVIEGEIDPKNPRTLEGSMPEAFEYLPGHPGQRMVTWHLSH
jgi:hypothetical protein